MEDKSTWESLTEKEVVSRTELDIEHKEEFEKVNSTAKRIKQAD